MKQIWKEGKVPIEWKKSIIVPLYKRGDQEEVGNYRGISLLCTAYKVYAEVLRMRLEKVIEEKNLVPESQTGFRKGKSAIDNIFVLNHRKKRSKETKYTRCLRTQRQLSTMWIGKRNGSSKGRRNKGRIDKES